jgi:hypothetical protein
VREKINLLTANMMIISKLSSFSRTFLFFILLAVTHCAYADWINLTGAETSPNIAEIYVLDDQVKVKLEVYIGDLEKFEELIPDDWITDPSIKRASLQQRMRTFATERFRFVTEDGTKLPATLELVEPRMRVDRNSAFAGMINPYTKQRVQAAPEDKRVLYAEISYAFNKKPQQLTIIPPTDARGNAIASIGFITYHNAVPVIDFRYLGQQAKLNLDWKDPWYTQFENKNLARHHKDPLMLFLYVEPRQVRLESLLRISDVKQMTGFNVDDLQEDPKNKHQRLQEHIKNYYADKQALNIDGKAFKSDLIRVEFLSATLRGLKVIEDSMSVDESSLLVGISQRVFIDSLPQKIDSQWQYFNQHIDRIPFTATDPVGPFQGLITKEDQEFEWQNFLKKYQEPVMEPVVVETGWNINLPYIGVTKILNQMPDQEEALSIVDGVLENIRVSYIEKEPNALSQALGQVISEKQTLEIEAELAKLFSPKVTGGAVGAVQLFNNVQVVDIRELTKSDGFNATIAGEAIISAQHWGHVDRRQLSFQLVLDLCEEDEQWRLADLTVVDIKEIK